MAPLIALASHAVTAAAREDSNNGAGEDQDSCFVRRVTSLPGSHAYAADFLEVMAGDPSPRSRERNAVWALSADLSADVPTELRALYVSKSTDGGKTWTVVARVDSRYFDAGIDEGLRNGLEVLPGGNEFVLTTQKGAFQVASHRDGTVVVTPVEGPRVPHELMVTVPKREGDPIRAAGVKITADGKRMVVGYGYFDLEPQLFIYHRGGSGSWVLEKQLAKLPTDLDILSMQWDKPGSARPDSLYVGTGDQVYRLNLQTMKWTLVGGVEPDSAIHAINTVGGLHLAACWGVYEPVSADMVARVTNAEFIYHRDEDETGPNIRAYGIEIDPTRPSRQVVTALTGVYISRDGGQNWRRLNNLPEGEYRTAHFNPEGTVILSGMPGTFLANPFSSSCGPRLLRRQSGSNGTN